MRGASSSGSSCFLCGGSRRFFQYLKHGRSVVQTPRKRSRSMTRRSNTVREVSLIIFIRKV